MYEEFRPDPRLLPFVECGWSRSGPGTSSARVLPDGCVDLFVTTDGDVLLAGPATTCYRLPDSAALAGLRLRPDAAAVVLGQPVGELRDIRVPLDSVVRGDIHRISERLCRTTAPGSRMVLLQDMLTGLLTQAEPLIDRPIRRAVQLLRARPDQPVASLAADVGLSERQLRRRFEAAVGYGPKRLGRVFRFQRLLDLIHAGHHAAGWAQLAVTAGYADQSHLIRECSALAGGPPTALPGAQMSVSSNPADGAPA